MINSDQAQIVKAAVTKFREEVWEKLIEIKIPHLHQQHCQLVGYLIETFEILEKQKVGMLTADELAAQDTILTKVENYVIHHLREEEEFLERIGFPEFKQHKIAHDKFAQHFSSLRKQHGQGSAQSITTIFESMYNWLFKHINSEDTKYSEYYVQKPLASDFPSGEYLLDTIMDSTVDGIIIINQDGIILKPAYPVAAGALL